MGNAPKVLDRSKGLNDIQEETISKNLNDVIKHIALATNREYPIEIKVSPNQSEYKDNVIHVVINSPVRGLIKYDIDKHVLCQMDECLIEKNDKILLQPEYRDIYLPKDDIQSILFDREYNVVCAISNLDVFLPNVILENGTILYYYEIFKYIEEFYEYAMIEEVPTVDTNGEWDVWD